MVFERGLDLWLWSAAESADGVAADRSLWDVISGGDGMGPLLLVGVAVLVAIPCLALVGSMFRSATQTSGNQSESGGSGQVPSPIGKTSSGNSMRSVQSSGDAATETLITGHTPPSVADPKRLTTQALRSPPRSGRARILVLEDVSEAAVPATDATGRFGSGEGSGGAVPPSDAAHKSDVYVFSQGDLLRIGREADNDIVLGSKTVHRYHAVIRRTRDAGYVLVDLSGTGGNGVHLNGERILDGQLRDGDQIVLGTARLKFIVDH
ncbi:MAG: FHA domain-containing protein [Pseudomonadota bacterium]